MKSYYRQCHKLTIEDRCPLRGTQVVILEKHQEAVLAELHLNHPGIVRMKALARLHVDYCGPFHGKFFLVIVDAKSKWLEVLAMSSTTAEATVQALRFVFSTHGLPEEIVSDNGPQFIVQEFKDFFKCNYIILLSYHTTLHTATGCMPAELLMNCRICNRLDVLRPDLRKKVAKPTKCTEEAFDCWGSSSCSRLQEKLRSLSLSLS